MSLTTNDNAQDLQQNLQCATWKKTSHSKKDRFCADKNPYLVRKFEKKQRTKQLGMYRMKNIPIISIFPNDPLPLTSTRTAPVVQLASQSLPDKQAIVTFDVSEWIIVDDPPPDGQISRPWRLFSIFTY